MKKKSYQTPQMEIVNISVMSMMAISDFNSNVFDGIEDEPKPGGGNANRRRNSWGNTNW